MHFGLLPHHVLQHITTTFLVVFVGIPVVTGVGAGLGCGCLWNRRGSFPPWPWPQASSHPFYHLLFKLSALKTAPFKMFFLHLPILQVMAHLQEFPQDILMLGWICVRYWFLLLVVVEG